MKRVLRTCLAAAAIMAGPTACVNHESTPGDSGLPGAIAFGVSPASRAIIDDATQIDAFHVWAYHYGEGNTDVTDVFNETLVEKVGDQWMYEPLQQWKAGVTYNFYAIYPFDDLKHAGLEKENTPMPYFIIYPYQPVNPDGSITDLVYAEAKGLTYSEAIGAQPVKLTFYHLLARVRFKGKVSEASVGIPGFEPRVYSAKLYGMYKDGRFSSEEFVAGNVESIRKGWTVPATGGGEDLTTSESGRAYVEMEDVNGVKLTTEGVDILTEVPMIPQQLTPTFCVEIVYSTDGGRTKHQQQVQLNSLPLTTWEAGQVYTYTFTVSDDERILFDTPTVNAWEEASGGIIIVD